MNHALPDCPRSASGLPSFDEMYTALCDRNSFYEGVFVVGVKTTGIFCRPTCPARKPRRENVTFYRNNGDAIAHGFRPCKRCRPLSVAEAIPEWVEQLLSEIEADPSARLTDEVLQQRGIQPATVRRWFNKHYGMTFQAYQRMQRLNRAAIAIQSGDQVTDAAFNNGYDSLSGFREAFQKHYGTSPGAAPAHSPPIIVDRRNTPLGPIMVGAIDDELCLLEFADRVDLDAQFSKLLSITKRRFVTGPSPVFDRLTSQLDEYFRGARQAFNLPLCYPGSPFQTRIWNALLSIPYGNVCSYQQIARKVGKPGAQRAVGKANGSNRIAIVIPCHRVVRSDGKPGGYAGEVWRKQRLLELEQGQTNAT